jgi:hypothetical protein
MLLRRFANGRGQITLFFLRSCQFDSILELLSFESRSTVEKMSFAETTKGEPRIGTKAAGFPARRKIVFSGPQLADDEDCSAKTGI